MHRIDTSGSSGGMFQDTATPKTQVDAAWLNDMQENVMAVLTAAAIAPVKGTYTQLRDAINVLIAAGASNAVPPGAKMDWCGPTPPAGWLACDGSAVSRTTYAALFSVISTDFGAGNGTTTFNVPDFRGEFIRGLDGGRGVDPGRTRGSFKADTTRAHNHLGGVADDQTNHFVYGASTTDMPGLAGQSLPGDGNPRTFQGLTSTTGGSETAPRSIALPMIIKY